VGGTKDISLNVHILCATNKPLEKLVEQKLFRDDLYYRLNVLSIVVPPLRDHKEDIPSLVASVITAQGFSHKFDPSALDVLRNYDWPGNIRELKNVVERTCILCPNRDITAEDVSFLKVKSPAEKRAVSEPGETQHWALSDMERDHIIAVLKFVNGHKGKAAKLLEINAKTLYGKSRNTTSSRCTGELGI